MNQTGIGAMTWKETNIQVTSEARIRGATREKVLVKDHATNVLNQVLFRGLRS
jgi:hypothetical protein